MTDRLTDEQLRSYAGPRYNSSATGAAAQELLALRARCAKLETALRRTVKWRDWSIAERALAQPAESEPSHD